MRPFWSPPTDCARAALPLTQSLYREQSDENPGHDGAVSFRWGTARDFG